MSADEDPKNYAAAERQNKAIDESRGLLDQLISYSIPKSKNGRGAEMQTTEEMRMFANRLDFVMQGIQDMIEQCKKDTEVPSHRPALGWLRGA